MAKYLIYKNKRFRSHLFRLRKSFFVGKYLSLNEKINKDLKFKTMLKMQNLFSYYFLSKIKNRCIQTNYPRSVIRLTNTSKSATKHLFSKKLLTGFKKSSW